MGSLVLRHAVSMLSIDSQGHHDHPAGDPHSNPTGDLTDRYATNELQPKNFAHLAHGGSLCGHRVPPLEAKGADLSRPAEAPDPRARSSRNGGRHHLGTVGEIISESVGDIIPE